MNGTKKKDIDSRIASIQKGAIALYESMAQQIVPSNQVLLILRRYQRKEFSTWQVSHRYRIPQERVFYILDEGRKKSGEIVYTAIGPGGRSGTAATPWGQATISIEGGLRKGRRGYYEIRLSERVISKVFPGITSPRFSFPGAPEMSFIWLKKVGVLYTFQNESCEVTVSVAKGDDTHRVMTPISKDELKALPKEDRPSSNETNHYTEFTIRSSGTLPISAIDLTVSLALYLSWDLLAEEQYGRP